MAFYIDLFGIPPTRDDLAAAFRTTREGAAREARREQRFLIAELAAVVILVIVFNEFISSRTWGWLSLVAFLAIMGIFYSMAHRGVLPDDYEAVRELNLDPIGPTLAADVLAACELDPRVDLYRQAVVTQGRELTVLEGVAFQKWQAYGYEASVNMSKVRSKAPVNHSEPPETEVFSPYARTPLRLLASRLAEFGLDGCDEAAALVRSAIADGDLLEDLGSESALFNAVWSLVEQARKQDLELHRSLALEAIEAEMRAAVLRLRIAMESKRDEHTSATRPPLAA